MTTVTNSLLLPISKKLCKKILQLRKELRLTQNDLSKKCFCSKTALSAYETGKRKVTLHFVLALAELSHYDIDSIIDDTRDLQKLTTKTYELTEKEQQVIDNYRCLSAKRQDISLNIIAELNNAELDKKEPKHD